MAAKLINKLQNVKYNFKKASKRNKEIPANLPEREGQKIK